MRRRYLFSACALILALPCALCAQASGPAAAVSIVLPPRLLANAPATLAILGADGHLASGVSVDIGNGQRGVTDAIGRLTFIAPPDGAFIATASGVSAAALVDESTAPGAKLEVPSAVSQHDRFPICGAGFQPQLDANRVIINGDPAFVLAGSPVCLVILPQSRTFAGQARIEVQAKGLTSSAIVSLVDLDFVPPNPPLEPGRKGKFLLRANGTTDPIEFIFENRSPDVLQFMRGDREQLRTSGGPANQVSLEAKGLRSGDFSLRARILVEPDPLSAARFVEIAAGLAPKNIRAQLRLIAANLEKHPRDFSKRPAELMRLANSASPGALRVLIDAALEALGSVPDV